MKFIINQGELLQININNWLTANKYISTCYQVYSGDAVIYDATMIKNQYIRKSDIISACATTPNVGNYFYIETEQGGVFEFNGTVTTIGLLNAEFNNAISKPKVAFKS